MGVCFLLLGLGAWLFFRDDPAPQTSDLLPRWSRLQDPANPLAQFCESVSDTLPFWGQIDDKKIREFEQGGSAAFLKYQHLIKSPIETWAWTDRDNMLTWHREDPVHFPIVGIQKYLEEKYELALRNNHQEEALICAIHLLKLGTGIAKAEGDHHRLDLATTLYVAGLKALKSAIQDPNTPAPVMRKALESLDQYSGPTSDDYAFALRICHVLAIKILETAKAQGAELLIQDSPFPTSRVPLLKRTLKPNRTLQWRATNTRETLTALEEGGALKAFLRGQEQIAAIRPMEANRNRWSYLADGNYAGKHFHIGWTTSTPTFLTSLMTSGAIRHALRIELALRLYEIDHHQFPASLNDLVPTYLPSVPSDPFSNAPMRWHKGKRTIYSIGTNLADDGGDVKPFTYLHELQDQPDIGIAIRSEKTSNPSGPPKPASSEDGPALNDR